MTIPQDADLCVEMTNMIANALRMAAARYPHQQTIEIDADGVDLTITRGDGKRVRLTVIEIEAVDPIAMPTPEEMMAALQERAAAMDAQLSGEAA
ncbi:hypothetical protein WG907_04295 [Sphingobium sp. AN558]|uniref:hypothetical protein n=1 Tax=Sphingobium sp. AN558 TaxID=3133442 RepID=UPI0030C3EF32